MDDYVQYHNIEVQGPSGATAEEMGIFTNKRVSGLEGSRVWLVSGEGKPRQYALVGAFIISRVSEKRSGPNTAHGKTIVRFDPPASIQDAKWLPALRRATGSFGFGLQRLKDPNIVQGLLAVCSSNAQAETAPTTSGAMFGTPEENAEVERAAVRAASMHYEVQGWKVTSHEKENRGYDLHCTKDKAIQHVEVKGVRGSARAFILTAKEKQFAERTPTFRLCVVLNALSPQQREIREYSAEQLASGFNIEPISFWVRPK